MGRTKWIVIVLVVAFLAATGMIFSAPAMAQSCPPPDYRCGRYSSQVPVIPAPPSDYVTRSETESLVRCAQGLGSCAGFEVVNRARQATSPSDVRRIAEQIAAGRVAGVQRQVRVLDRRVTNLEKTVGRKVDTSAFEQFKADVAQAFQGVQQRFDKQGARMDDFDRQLGRATWMAGIPLILVILLVLLAFALTIRGGVARRAARRAQQNPGGGPAPAAGNP